MWIAGGGRHGGDSGVVESGQRVAVPQKWCGMGRDLASDMCGNSGVLRSLL